MTDRFVLFSQITQRKNCGSDDKDPACTSILPTVSANENEVQNGLAIVFGVFAAVAIIVIIVAAINFATSEGNPENISNAKKTIIYALIGLIIALSAEAAVFFLLGNL
jgi:NADH:ubiquinone oxidoreductase subunit 6 (subunit J)